MTYRRERKMKKKILKIVLIVVAAIVLSALLAVSAFSVVDRVKHWDFYKNTEKGFTTPGLWDGFVPQGFDYIEERGVYITSGYMKDGEASRIYVTDSKGDSTYVALKMADGSCNTSHAGGVSFDGEYIYVTGSGENDGKKSTVDVYKMNDVLDGDCTAVACDRIEICVKPSFLYAREGVLYVGEFYRPDSYETDSSHHIKTPAGETNHALIAVYELGDNGKPADIVPSKVYSVRDQVQGIAFDSEGRIIMSTSFGLASSFIYVYDTKELTKGSINIEGKDVDVYHIDSDNLKATVKAPPMTEEMVVSGDTLMIMCESACMKYLYGKITSGNHVYNFDYSSIKFD